MTWGRGREPASPKYFQPRAHAIEARRATLVTYFPKSRTSASTPLSTVNE